MNISWHDATKNRSFRREVVVLVAACGVFYLGHIQIEYKAAGMPLAPRDPRKSLESSITICNQTRKYPLVSPAFLISFTNTISGQNLLAYHISSFSQSSALCYFPKSLCLLRSWRHIHKSLWPLTVVGDWEATIHGLSAKISSNYRSRR